MKKIKYDGSESKTNVFGGSESKREKDAHEMQ